jgi:hypothetical protein
MANCVIIGIFIFSLSIAPSLSFASWSGPQEVVVGTWGAGVGQFYFAAGDTTDSFPREFGADKDGFIVISDSGNKRIVIYNADGTFKTTLTKPAELPDLDSVKKWPYGFILYSGGNSFMVNCNYQKTSSGRGPSNLCFINYNGLISRKIDIAQVFSAETGFITFKNNLYSLYSPTGQLIKTSAERPLELGKVSSQRIGSGQYKSTITYSDTVYQIIADQPIEKYYRDLNINLYQIETFTETVDDEEITSYKVHKYSKCSKQVSLLNIPRSQYEAMPSEASSLPTWKPIPIMEYGEPLVSSSGDVYAWARTKTQYKILKWTWQDDSTVPSGPDAPTGLTVTPSTTGLYLAWTASAQDPGCVTGYEVARATTSGGVLSTVGTVAASVLKYNDTTASAGTTYYYKIRVVAGSEYSPYTAGVSGMR